jgi:hypothetical protein
LLERLREDFPTRPAYQYELANVFNSLAAVLWAGEQCIEAHKACTEALRLQRALVKQFPTVPDYHSALGGTLDNLAVLMRDGKPPQLDEARRLLQEAAAHHAQAIHANARHRNYCRSLRLHYQVLADTLLRQKDHGGASDAAQQMVGVYPNDWQRYQRAAGLLARCVPLAEQDKHEPLAQQYADRCVAMLREAVAHGFNDAAHLKGTAYDGVRKRNSGLDRLVQEMENKKPW